MPNTARLGLDWGKARIGVAACPAGTSLAFPVETVPAGPDALARVRELVAEHRAQLVYLGLPLALGGGEELAARDVLAVAGELARTVEPIEVRLVDERMSSASASRRLSGAGHSSRKQRSVIDQAAAVEILQNAVDQELARGHAGRSLGGIG